MVECSYNFRVADQPEWTKVALKKSIADVESVMKGLING